MEMNTARSARYRQYLQSPDWRRTRNRAMKRADWRCARCQSRRDLEVHHTSYERLGHEWDGDLEVLCAICHGTDEHQRSDAFASRVYYKLAAELVDRGEAHSPGELSEALKVRCARLCIPYTADLIDGAISALSNRLKPDTPDRPRYVPPPDRHDQPFSKAEAAAFLLACFKKDGPEALGRMVKEMPSPPSYVWKQQEDEYFLENVDTDRY